MQVLHIFCTLAHFSHVHCAPACSRPCPSTPFRGVTVIFTLFSVSLTFVYSTHYFLTYQFRQSTPHHSHPLSLLSDTPSLILSLCSPCSGFSVNPAYKPRICHDKHGASFKACQSLGLLSLLDMFHAYQANSEHMMKQIKLEKEAAAEWDWLLRMYQRSKDNEQVRITWS